MTVTMVLPSRNAMGVFRTKTCSRCNTTKPVESFYPQLSNKDGLQKWCKDCKNQVQREHRAMDTATAEKMRAYDRLRYRGSVIRRRLGVEPERVAELLSMQKGVCAVCGNPETKTRLNGETKDLAVDHNHQTGQIRGLLCSRCNMALGLLGDDVERIRALVAYLEKWEKQ